MTTATIGIAMATTHATIMTVAIMGGRIGAVAATKGVGTIMIAAITTGIITAVAFMFILAADTTIAAITTTAVGESSTSIILTDAGRADAALRARAIT